MLIRPGRGRGDRHERNDPQIHCLENITFVSPKHQKWKPSVLDPDKPSIPFLYKELFQSNEQEEKKNTTTNKMDKGCEQRNRNRKIVAHDTKFFLKPRLTAEGMSMTRCSFMPTDACGLRKILTLGASEEAVRQAPSYYPIPILSPG